MAREVQEHKEQAVELERRERRVAVHERLLKVAEPT